MLWQIAAVGVGGLFALLTVPFSYLVLGELLSPAALSGAVALTLPISALGLILAVWGGMKQT